MPSNIFDWKGPEFLALYGALMVACAGLGLILRWLCRFPLDDAPEAPILDSYETAYLADGAKRVTETAIARLLSMDVINIKMSPKGAAHLSLVDRNFRPTHPVEEVVIAGAAQVDSAMNVRMNVERNALSFRDRLAQYGLVPNGLGTLLSRIGGMLLCLLMIIGMTKGVIGLMRDKPIGFLAIFLILNFALIFWLFRLPVRSGRGDKVLRQLKHDSAALELYLQSHIQRTNALDVGYGVALFGFACLNAAVYPELKNVLAAKDIAGSSSNGCGSGCGGGGGCGGGCGGCGS